MSGLSSSIYALAIAVQSDPQTPATISNADDLFPCANLRPGGQTFTQANPESTGTKHAPGDEVLGRDANDSFEFLMRGPGGTAPPAADEYVPGRVLRAAGFAEISDTAGITAETLGAASDNAGDTTVVTLGSSASATDGAYVGYTIQFSDIASGTGAKSLSQIIAYDGATKQATLGEKLATAPAANYVIPPQLVYRLDADAPDLALTHHFWLHKKAYYRQNGIPSQLNLTFNTSARQNTALSVMNVSLQSEIDDANDEADQTAPLVPALGSTSPFRDGKQILNGVPIGGQSANYNHGITVGFPPDPNKPSGTAAGCITRTQRSVALNLNEELLSVQDRNALAAAQTEVPFMIQYGLAPGKTILFCVPKGRLDFSNPDAGGEFVTANTTLFIDDAEKAVCLSFPYYT